jgi:hypothetical protein
MIFEATTHLRMSTFLRMPVTNSATIKLSDVIRSDGEIIVLNTEEKRGHT